jgi:hypothetical protein
MKLLFLFTSVVCVQFFSCSGVHEAVKTQDVPNCKTAVGGFLHSKVTFNGKVPVLLLPDSIRGKIIFYGKILEKNSEGIIFDPDKEGLFYNPEPKLYPYSDIQCAIDSEGNIVYGGLPEIYTNIWSMNLELIQTTKPNEEPIMLILEANHPFSYCLNPGVYKVKGIRFRSNRSYIDESISLPKLTLTINQDCFNYIGDLFLDYASQKEPSICIIQTKTLTPGIGFVLGVIENITGGVKGADYYYRKTWDVDNPKHSLRISVDSAFSTSVKLPIQLSPLQFEENSH